MASNVSMLPFVSMSEQLQLNPSGGVVAKARIARGTEFKLQLTCDFCLYHQAMVGNQCSFRVQCSLVTVTLAVTLCRPSKASGPTPFISAPERKAALITMLGSASGSSQWCSCLRKEPKRSLGFSLSA